MHRRKISNLAALAVLGLLAVTVPGGSPEPVATAAAAPAPTPAQQAKTTGKPVAVPALTAENRQVVANPDGTYTAEFTAVPTRVRRGAGWVPVDASLAAASGRVEPKAVTIPVSFSGGGTQPLVRFGKPGAELDLTWPGALPKPTLSGDTATYAEVLPGVDLLLRAAPAGYSEVLRVKDRAAAANPALARLTLGVRTDGLTVRHNADSSFDVVDPAGKVVYSSPAPQLSDATGEHRATGTTELAAGKLVVKPDLAFLTDPKTAFPVSIDPDFTPGKNGWTEVYAQFVTTSYWNGQNEDPNVAKVGYQSFSPVVTVRSFFQYDVTPLIGADIQGAEFNIHETYSPSCAARNVYLNRVTPISPGTTWQNQPADLGELDRQNVAHGYSASCLPDNVGFGATGAVTGALAPGGGGLATLRLTADEGDKLGWKKFDPNTAKLTVHYNHPPDTPVDLAANTPLTPNLPCSTTPDAVFSASGNLTLHARVTDPDGGPVNAYFSANDQNGAERWNSGWTPMQNSGSTFQVTIPDGLFGNHDRISWAATGGDGIRASVNGTSRCLVTIDTEKPDAVAASSPTYALYDPAVTDGSVFGNAGSTGTFLLDANKAADAVNADVAGFYYSWTGSGAPRYAAADATGGKASVPLTPNQPGPNAITVYAVDRAGNAGPPKTWNFFVGDAVPPVAHWDLDGHAGETVAHDEYARHNGTLTGDAGWVAGRNGDAVHFGPGGAISTAGGQGVHTNSTFAISAWVKPDTLDGDIHVAVSQDGTDGGAGRYSGFYLGYGFGHNSYMFAMRRENAVGDVFAASAPDTVVPGVWTHLVGEYDAATHQAKLFIDGASAAAATADVPVTWEATGPVQIGRAAEHGTYMFGWPGAVDDVRLYDRLPLTVSGTKQSEVDTLATSPATPEASWELDDAAGTLATDSSGNAHTATLNSGVSWATGHVGGGARFDGTSGAIDAGGPMVRTDRAFTVTATVLADSLTSPLTAVSQDGVAGDGAAADGSGFYLQYSQYRKAWDFWIPGVGEAMAPPQPPASEKQWVGLTGVFDPGAGQLRLYINGALAAKGTIAPGTTYTRSSGHLMIGRSKFTNLLADYWQGQIDQVKVWSGVRTEDEIRADWRKPAPVPSPFAGQLTRWVGPGGQHVSSAGAAPAGFHAEGGLGVFAPAGTPGTHTLYECTSPGNGQFTSPSADCEGYLLVAKLGQAYDSPPAGVAVRQVFRCSLQVGPTWLHMDSVDPKCEGTQVDGPLGYLKADYLLVRYSAKSQPADTVMSFGWAPGDYAVGAAVGYVTAGGPGTQPLYGCKLASDLFDSTDSGCLGGTLMLVNGAVWTSDPGQGVRLMSCQVVATGERFESTDQFCGGQNVVGPLGWLATTLPS